MKQSLSSFFYGSYRRSVCVDYLPYNKDGTMKRVVMTSEGIGKGK